MHKNTSEGECQTQIGLHHLAIEIILCSLSGDGHHLIGEAEQIVSEVSVKIQVTIPGHLAAAELGKILRREYALMDQELGASVDGAALEPIGKSMHESRMC